MRKYFTFICGIVACLAFMPLVATAAIPAGFDEGSLLEEVTAVSADFIVVDAQLSFVLSQPKSEGFLYNETIATAFVAYSSPEVLAFRRDSWLDTNIVANVVNAVDLEVTAIWRGTKPNPDRLAY